MYNISVNGQPFGTEADADTPLLWVLRDEVNLKGTKFGCGIGMCGACTVHVDGRAMRSCITPISAVSGCAITTIEGLSPDGAHPLQQVGLPRRRRSAAIASLARSCRRPPC